MQSDFEKNILKLLSNNRANGLYIAEIADSLKINRITATKYIAKLEGAKKVWIRNVGRAKVVNLI